MCGPQARNFLGSSIDANAVLRMTPRQDPGGVRPVQDGNHMSTSLQKARSAINSPRHEKNLPPSPLLFSDRHCLLLHACTFGLRIAHTHPRHLFTARKHFPLSPRKRNNRQCPHSLTQLIRSHADSVISFLPVLAPPLAPPISARSHKRSDRPSSPGPWAGRGSRAHRGTPRHDTTRVSMTSTTGAAQDSVGAERCIGVIRSGMDGRVLSPEVRRARAVSGACA
jgi:hypothetical protein